MYFILLLIFSGCNSIQNDYREIAAEEFTMQPLQSEEVLSESDIRQLPAPVRKYIIYTEALGKNRPQNVRIAFDAAMTKKRGSAPMDASSEQYNFFARPARFFFMKASQYLVSFRVFHAYRDQHASMVVRVASLFNAVDIGGEEFTKAETVTLLNDLYVFAPANLIDKRLAWKDIDSLTVCVTITNGPYNVSAFLYFNEKGELVNFVSEDRAALQNDGTLRKTKWSTPLRDYKEIDGRKAPHTEKRFIITRRVISRTGHSG